MWVSLGVGQQNESQKVQWRRRWEGVEVEAADEELEAAEEAVCMQCTELLKSSMYAAR